VVMFSHLRRFTVRDEHGADASLRDLSVDLSAHDYPPVARIIFRHNQRAHLGWEEVRRIDLRQRRIIVSDLARATPLADEPLEKSALLDRDVLDALVLDLANRHSMRANDLWLEEHDGKLELRAADISAWAVVRRLGNGLLGHGSHRHLLDWQDVEFLRGDPSAARGGHDYHHRVASLQPSEIARLLDAVPYLHAAELLELVDKELAADTLEVMRPERQVQVFEELMQERRIGLLRLMAPDHAADLLARLGPDRARDDLEALPKQQRERVLELLRYPDNSAGGIMTNDLVLVESHLRVGEARDALRERLLKPDFVYYVYVVDSLEARRLEGVVTLRDLLVAEPRDGLRETMRRGVAILDPLMSADAAAHRVADQHLAALPVVDKDGRLLGTVTADAALLQLAPASMRGAEPRVFT